MALHDPVGFDKINLVLLKFKTIINENVINEVK